MTTETQAVMMIMVLLWTVIIILDAAVCGILHLVSGIAFRKAFLWGLAALFLPPVLTAYGALVERNMFRIKEIEIGLETLPETFDGYRILHISDIHARSFAGRETHLEKAVAMMNGQQPDLVAFTGDLITMLPEELDGISKILGRIRAEDGVVSVPGNHDYCLYTDLSAEEKQVAFEDLVSREREMGWKVLLNSHHILVRGKDSVAVIGVENTSPSRYFISRGDLTRASEGTEGMFRIVLSHDPLHWESEILGQDFPLTLSGHTHAMQLSIFGFSPSRLMFPQYRGLYSCSAECRDDTGGDCMREQHIHVNIGLGETIFPARIGARPEMTMITLRRKQGYPESTAVNHEDIYKEKALTKES